MVYDRPVGQSEPVDIERPPKRFSTVAFVGSTCLVGFGAWVILLATRVAAQPDPVVASIVFAFFAHSTIFPLQIAYKQELTLDLVVAVMAALLLPPFWAVPIAVIGYAVGYGIRYRGKFDLDCPFNASIVAISLATTGVAFRSLGWSWDDATPPVWRLIAFGLLAAAIVVITIRVLVAVIVHNESGQPLWTVLRDSTFAMQPAEQAMLAAMTGLGIIGAIVAQHSPWALLLLVAPAFALWLALRQNVETRHRIEASLATAQQVAGLGSLDWDLRRGDIQWSDLLFRILGYDLRSDRPTADAYVQRVHAQDRPKVLAAFNHAAEGKQVEIDHRIALPTGEPREFNLKFRGLPDRSGRIKRIVGTVHDVTERKRLEDRLHFQAYHDPLTGLPNRALFLQRLDAAFARAGRHGTIALLYLDLDRFKLINDTLGHEAGDELLQTVARRLEGCIRPNDLVARLGGDEFTVLLDGVSTDAEATTVADRIIAAINQPVTLLGSRELVPSTSVGIVRPSRAQTSGADLLRDADTALYRAKESGRNRYAVFDGSMGAATLERLSLEEDLRGAIERGEFSLAFQPKIVLATGEIHAVEALVRWTHPVRGDVPPLQFIPVAEETGLIDPIGSWILRTAVREALTWARVMTDPPILSVNITSKQLHDLEFGTQLKDLLASAQLPPERMRLEVPENTAMKNVDATIQALWRLRQLGVRIAIDDFGTGQSSLSSLRRFPVDALQLGHQFVAELGSAREAMAITRAIIDLAHGLDLKVVAKGVEHATQAEGLKGLGCELAQGNLFCPPLPAPEILAYLVRLETRNNPDAKDDPPNLRRIHHQ